MDRLLLEYKMRMQKAKNKLKNLNGVSVLEILEGDQNTALNNMLAACHPLLSYAYAVPHSKIAFEVTEDKLLFWIISEMHLENGQECFFLCDDVWARLRLVDLRIAVKSLWEHNLERQGAHRIGSVGFLIINSTMSSIMDVGCDSRDEYHYLMDIWDYIL